MKTFMTFLAFFTFLFSGSFSLQCYFGIYPNITLNTSPCYNSKFCAIVKYKNGTFDNCENEVCIEIACDYGDFCKEPGISYEHEIEGMKFEINCCEKDLCNLESFESSAQITNKIHFFFRFYCFVLFFSLFNC